MVGSLPLDQLPNEWQAVLTAKELDQLVCILESIGDGECFDFFCEPSSLGEIHKDAKVLGVAERAFSCGSATRLTQCAALRSALPGVENQFVAGLDATARTNRLPLERNGGIGASAQPVLDHRCELRLEIKCWHARLLFRALSAARFLQV